MVAPAQLGLALLLALARGAVALSPRAYLYSDASCNTTTQPLEAWSDVCSVYGGAYGLALSACTAGVNASFSIFSSTDGSCSSSILLTYSATTACAPTAYGGYIKLAPGGLPCAIAPATLFLVSPPLDLPNCSLGGPTAYFPTLVGACSTTGYSGLVGSPSNTTFDAGAATLTSTSFLPGTCSGPQTPYSYASLPVNGTCGSGVGSGGKSYLARVAAPFVPPPPPPPLVPGQHTVAVFSDAACTQSQGFLDAWVDRCSTFNGLDVALTACSAGASVTVALSPASATTPCSGQGYGAPFTVTPACTLIPFLGQYAKLVAVNPTACALGAEPLFVVSSPYSTANCSGEGFTPSFSVRTGACIDAQYFGVYPTLATFSAAAGTLSMTAFNPGSCAVPVPLYTFANVPTNGTCSQGFRVRLAPPYTPPPPVVPAEHTMTLYR